MGRENLTEDFTDQAPYVLALVDLEGNEVILAQITDLDFRRAGSKLIYPFLEGEDGNNPFAGVGKEVEVVIRKLRTDGESGVIVYGRKVRPVVSF